MKIFLCYASEQRPLAARLAHALRAAGHTVFFDRDSLPPGSDYTTRIREFVRATTWMVFLASRESIEAGCYTLTELRVAEETWSGAEGHLLPVLTDDTRIDELPAFVRSVSVLEPRGEIVAEVMHVISEASRLRRNRRIGYGAACLAALLGTGVGASYCAPHEPPAVAEEARGAEQWLRSQGIPPWVIPPRATVVIKTGEYVGKNLPDPGRVNPEAYSLLMFQSFQRPAWVFLKSLGLDSLGPFVASLTLDTDAENSEFLLAVMLNCSGDSLEHALHASGATALETKTLHEIEVRILEFPKKKVAVALVTAVPEGDGEKPEFLKVLLLGDEAQVGSALERRKSRETRIAPMMDQFAGIAAVRTNWLFAAPPADWVPPLGLPAFDTVVVGTSTLMQVDLEKRTNAAPPSGSISPVDLRAHAVVRFASNEGAADAARIFRATPTALGGWLATLCEPSKRGLLDAIPHEFLVLLVAAVENIRVVQDAASVSLYLDGAALGAGMIEGTAKRVLDGIAGCPDTWSKEVVFRESSDELAQRIEAALVKGQHDDDVDALAIEVGSLRRPSEVILPIALRLHATQTQQQITGLLVHASLLHPEQLRSWIDAFPTISTLMQNTLDGREQLFGTLLLGSIMSRPMAQPKLILALLDLYADVLPVEVEVFVSLIACNNAPEMAVKIDNIWDHLFDYMKERHAQPNDNGRVVGQLERVLAICVLEVPETLGFLDKNFSKWPLEQQETFAAAVLDEGGAEPHRPRQLTRLLAQGSPAFVQVVTALERRLRAYQGSRAG